MQQYAFNVDPLSSAIAVDKHLKSLASRPESPAQNTVVVAGGGFTGIETVCEMPQRLRDIPGQNAKIRIAVLEYAPSIGPDPGPIPRPVIEQALAECGVEVIIATGAAAIDADGVTTSTGRRIETHTVVWTAGSRANPLAAQIDGAHDRLGRVHADQFLRAKSSRDIFVTGAASLQPAKICHLP